MALVCLVVGTAYAGPTEDRLARAKFDEGLALSDAGRWVEALEAFRESDRLKPAVSVRYNIAATLRALGRYVEAKRAARHILEGSDRLQPKPKLREQTEELLTEVSAKIGRLELSLRPDTARVEIDGAPVDLRPGEPIEVDPGRHVFVVKAPGHETTTVTHDVPSGESGLTITAPKLPPAPVTARPGPTEEEEPIHEKWWLWTTVVGGAAVAAVVIAVVVVTLPEDPVAPTPPATTIGNPIPVILRF
jgi:hypothetical protein